MSEDAILEVCLFGLFNYFLLSAKREKNTIWAHFWGPNKGYIL